MTDAASSSSRSLPVPRDIDNGNGTDNARSASWERDARQGMPGIRTNNSALWDTNTTTAGSSRGADTLSAAGTSPAASLSIGQKSSVLDKITTTLPLNGDAHNPLSVLVELSEAASALHPHESPSSAFRDPSSKRQREEDDYYAPLERTLKEEAPHIMALINTHE